MPTMSSVQVPTPSSWSEFEKICVALVERRYRPIGGLAQSFGRNGQKQSGLDILIKMKEGLYGFQCKRHSAITLKTIQAELAKIDSGKVVLSHFTVLTTSAIDAKVQLAVLGLSADRERIGKCGVEVVYWDTICSWLAQNPDLFKSFFPEFFPGLPQIVKELNDKIERELPGLSIEFREGTVGSSIIIEAKPGISTTIAEISFIKSELGDAANERFVRAVQHGGSVKFTDEEVNINLPQPLREVVESRIGVPLTKLSVSLVNTLEGQSFPVKIVVRSRSEDHDISFFIRRSRGCVNESGLDGVLTLNRVGSETKTASVSFNRFPLVLLLESQMASNLSIDIDWLKITIEQYLPLLEVLKIGSHGGRMSIWPIDKNGKIIKEPVVISEFDVEGIKLPSKDTVKLLRLLADLSAYSGWDILIPAQPFSGNDIAHIRSMVELFRDGARTLHAITASILVSTDEQRFNIINSLGDNDKNSLHISLGSSDFEMCGYVYKMPPTVIESQSASVRLLTEVDIREAELPFMIPVRCEAVSGTMVQRLSE